MSKIAKIENIEFETTLESHPSEVEITELEDSEEFKGCYLVSQKNYSSIPQPKYSWEPKMTLPGNGQKKYNWVTKTEILLSHPYDSRSDLSVSECSKESLCGKPKIVYKSKSGALHIKHYNCHRLSCPECYPHTAQNNAVDYYNEILHPRMQGIFEKNRESGKFYHQVWSIDPQVCGLDKEGKNYNESEDILKEKVEYYLKHAAFNLMKKWNKETIKYPAHFVITHPWRLKKICAKCGTTVSHDGVVCGLHNKGTKQEFYCNSKKFHTYSWVQGFHLHLISNFYVDKLNMDAFNEDCAKLKVVHANISGSKRPLFYWSKADIIRIVSYQLTHAKFIPGKNSKCVTLGYFNPKYHTILSKEEKTKLVVDSNDNPFIEHNFDIKRVTKGWVLGNLNSKINEYVYTPEERLKYYLFEKSFIYQVKFDPTIRQPKPKMLTSEQLAMIAKKKEEKTKNINLIKWIHKVISRKINRSGYPEIELSPFSEPKIFEASGGKKIWICEYDNQQIIEVFDFV